MTAGVRFRSLNAALIRLAAHTDDGTLPSWPDLSGETAAHVPGWRDWLGRVWAREALVEAIEVASPHLAQRVEEVCAGRLTRPRRVRRVVESVVRYLLRMNSRATPFGLFAGVAPVRINATASVWAQQPVSAVARPDPGWLAAVIAELEARPPEVLPHLRVVSNNLGFVRADRWVLPWQQQPGDTDPAGLGEVSIRRTPAVQAALRAARAPITFSDLADKLATELPDAARTQIERMLSTLVAQRVLITNLHPPMTATDPLGHVIEQLIAAVPAEVCGEMVTDLRAVREQLTHYPRAASPHQRRWVHTATCQRMAAIRAQPKPRLAVDLRVGEVVELPPGVAREAEAAASALVALSPHPFGNPAWRAYHARFLKRYGSGAVVALTEVTNVESGLGFPAGYRGAVAAPLPAEISTRDRALLRLAQQAALDQHRELLIDDRRLGELAPQTADTELDAAPHTELRFHLHASSTQALEKGKFTLVVAGAARQAGTLTGRFLHLFEHPDREHMTQELAGLPALTPGAQLAQISCAPLAARTQHLARAPAVFPRISLGEHHPGAREDIALEDLAVTGDERRLWLVSLSRESVIEPVMLNAVEFRRATHPLARFLCEITTARAASCKPVEWGAAEALPFLPRLRYRRSVLAPARWSLAATDLPGNDASWSAWKQAWSHLRCRLGLPDTALLGEHDRLLRLELEEPAHLALLRRHLEGLGRVELVEAPEPSEYGWIGGRTHEIVLPMAATRPSEALSAAPRSGSIRLAHHPGHIPGNSPWLHARLHAHPDRHDDILTAHLPTLLEEWCEGPPGAWWFLRDHEPEPHLRLCLHLHDAGRYGAAAQRLGAWAARLKSLGLLRTLVLDTYYPETGRFGAGTALEAAEAVLAADSVAVLAQLAVTTSGTPHPQAITAASFADLVCAFTGDHEHGTKWLIDHPPPRPHSNPTREISDEALRLADPDQGPATLRVSPGGARLLEAWERRRLALATYRTHLAESGGPDVNPVMASLLHLHHTRMVGTSPESERTCLRLARAAALSWRTRRERSRPSPL